MCECPPQVLEATHSGTLSHVAVIMDGNGRWAQRQGLSRSEGHKKGVQVAEAIVNAACDAGLSHLTLYALSTENRRNRSLRELLTLKELLQDVSQRENPFQNKVQVKWIGSPHLLSPMDIHYLRRMERQTHQDTLMTLLLAYNYGAREEIAFSAGRLISEGVKAGAEVSPQMIEKHLWTHGVPDPDMILRTGNDQRISNFLLWQASYAEFFFVPKMWPDFTRVDFFSCLSRFLRRERRFGSAMPVASLPS